MNHFRFPAIDTKRTGEHLRDMFRERNISPKKIQELLRIGSTQTIYDWYKGRTLPSMDNMVALSRLLGCNMEELLVFRPAQEGEEIAERANLDVTEVEHPMESWTPQRK